jgi:CBS domain-containing protein
MCLAKEIMTLSPSLAREEHTIYEVVQMMSREDCGVIPVVDIEDKCVGIITDRDICLRLVLEHLDPEDTLANELMSEDVITCHPDDDMDEVIAKMEREQIRRIPVVDDSDQIVGIISEGDIAKSEVKPKVSELVEAVVAL